MSDAVKSLLLQLEAELKQQQLWRARPPGNAQMASTMPFCCDTMLLEQWLQFIFIPRLGALVNAGHALPANVSVLPYAQQVFIAQGVRLLPLLQLIEQIDSTLSGET